MGDSYGRKHGHSRDRKPVLIQAAKQHVKAGPTRPRWRFEQNGQVRKLISATVNFTVDGNSGMKFVCEGSLKDLENTFSNLWIGYGSHLEPYFSGRLMQPLFNQTGLYTEGQAQGVSARLGTRYVGERLTYNGKRIRWSAKDLMARAGINDSWWNIRDGTEEIDIDDDNDILFECSYLEALRMLIEPMDYVAIDQPGHEEMFTVRKKPGPLFWDGLEGKLEEGNYPKGGFEFKQGLRNYYSEVIVFRRDQEADEGEDSKEKFEVYARRKVKHNTSVREALGNRFFIIPDFTGNQHEAQKAATEKAKVLANAAGEFSLTCSPIDFDLYNTIAVGREEAGVQHDYSCEVHEIEMRLAPHVFEMTVTGDAIRRRRKRKNKRDRDGRRPRRSDALVASDFGSTPSTEFSGWGQEDVTFEDLTDDYSELY